MEPIQISSTAEQTAVELFYSQPFYFSYSSLTKLLWSPMVFYQLYLMRLKEESTAKHLVEGKVIHAIFLSMDKFDEEFLISQVNLPTGTSKTLIDRIYKDYYKEEMKDWPLSACHNELLQMMVNMNFYQALKDDKPTAKNPLVKSGNEKRLEKVITTETSNYWEFLKSKGKRTVIDQQTFEYCKSAAEILEMDDKIRGLMGLKYSEMDNVEIHNETLLKVELTKYPFGIQGILDNLVIDHDNKLININDLKTTSKPLKEFKDSVEYYDYWLQAAMYLTLVMLKYSELIEKGYLVKFHFIVIDNLFQAYAFPVSIDTQMQWIERMSEALEKANYHYTERKYELPYEFQKGLVEL